MALTQVSYPDNEKLFVGASNDLQIYHNGTNSYVQDAGTGSLYLMSDSHVYLIDSDGDTMVEAVKGGRVLLKHDNSPKFETTTLGVKVTGQLSLPAGESANPIIAIESAVDDNDFTVSQYEAVGGTYTLIGQNVKLDANGNEEILDSDHKTASIQLDALNHGAVTISTGDTNEHVNRMKIDKAGRVMIGTTTEGEATADNLTIADSGHCGITLRSGTGSVGTMFFSDGTSGGDEYIGSIQYDHSGNFFKWTVNGGERMRITSAGHLLLSQTTSNWGTSTDNTVIQLENSAIWDYAGIQLDVGHNYYYDGTDYHFIRDGYASRQTFHNNDGAIKFWSGGTGSADGSITWAERMNIVSTGAIIQSTVTGSPGLLKLDSSVGASDQVYISFEYGGDNSGGGIRRDGTSQDPEFYSGSDRRIKKDIIDLPDQLAKINQIKLKSYGYKSDSTASGIGPIAQDLISVYPNKVKKSDGDDGTGDTVPDGAEPWTIGTGFTWEIIKAIQELSAKVTALEAK